VHRTTCHSHGQDYAPRRSGDRFSCSHDRNGFVGISVFSGPIQLFSNNRIGYVNLGPPASRQFASDPETRTRESPLRIIGTSTSPEVPFDGEAFFSVVSQSRRSAFLVTTDDGVAIELLWNNFQCLSPVVDTKVVPIRTD